MTQPEPSEATVQIDVEDLVEELTKMVGALNQELAGARVAIRKQQSVISGLQQELISKADPSGADGGSS